MPHRDWPPPGPPGLLAARAISCPVDGGVVLVHVLHFDWDRFVAHTADSAIAYPLPIARSVPKRRAEFFFGRLAAAEAMRAAGWAAQPVAIGPQREPVWPAGIVGAISHSAGLAASCVSSVQRLQGVGIDIEQALTADAAAEVEDEVLTCAERQLLRSVGQLPHGLRLALAFSAKESIYKGLFGTVGQYFGFEAVAIEALDVQAARLCFRVRQPLGQAWPRGRTGTVHFRLLDHDTVLTVFGWQR